MDYARRNGYTINTANGSSVRVANNSLTKTIGTVLLPFSFSSERTVHYVHFNVLRNSLHDMILGGPFLRQTETFTKFKDRIVWKVRNMLNRSVNFIDNGASQQYILGWCNGTSAVALPDTSSDISLLSEEYAQSMGYRIQRGLEHRIRLRLGDGSIVYTQGMVPNVKWSYDKNDRLHREDFYVLRNLPCDAVLSCDFVWDTRALEDYSHLLFESKGRDLTTHTSLNVIVNERESLRQRLKDRLKSLFTDSVCEHAKPEIPATCGEPDNFENTRQALLRRLEDIDRLPQAEQAGPRQAWEMKWHELQKKRRPILAAQTR